MSKRFKTPSVRCSGAFSLIEVVIAIGIVSFAVLSSLGLNAVSISSLRDSRAQEISTRIFRSVLNEAQVSEFANLSGLVGKRYYDFEGSFLGTTDEPAAVYRAVISQMNAELSDPTASSILNDSTRLVVEVYRSGEETTNTLVSKRFAVIGNRMKSN
jgi:uncharacterized protein (TIGR02598 family)